MKPKATRIDMPVELVLGGKMPEVGDCMKLIPTLEGGSVGLVLTSPPYADQRQGHYNGVAEADYADWTVKWMAELWDKLADDASVLIVIRPHLKQGVISDYVLRTRLALRAHFGLRTVQPKTQSAANRSIHPKELHDAPTFLLLLFQVIGKASTIQQCSPSRLQNNSS